MRVLGGSDRYARAFSCDRVRVHAVALCNADGATVLAIVCAMCEPAPLACIGRKSEDAQVAKFSNENTSDIKKSFSFV